MQKAGSSQALISANYFTELSKTPVNIVEKVNIFYYILKEISNVNVIVTLNKTKRTLYRQHRELSTNI